MRRPTEGLACGANVPLQIVSLRDDATLSADTSRLAVAMGPKKEKKGKKGGKEKKGASVCAFVRL